jgi:DNA polymerase-3 subunit delta'
MWLTIEGHDAVVEQFRRTLAAGRLASTYLFLGPEGVGKRAFALRLAQTLLCQRNDPAEMAPCGQCDSCRLAVAGNHPDIDVVGFLKDKRNLLISQFIGEGDAQTPPGLCHNIALRPMMGRRRVAIIDEADRLTTESANCLLKTLEEPPPGAVIILIGTTRSRQLPTILSRAQVVRFQPLPLDVVRNLAISHGIAGDEPSAVRIAERSGGSLARARSLADDALFEMRDRFHSQWNSRSLDTARWTRDLDEFINSAGKEADARRQRFKQLLQLIAASDGGEGEFTLAAIDRTLEAEEQIDRNANQATLLETWLDDLAGLLGERQTGRPAVDRR